MRWFDFGEEAHGVLAIGQVATGVVAFGQFAYGVVAVGQFAFGGVAVGQVALGGVAIGLVGGGLYSTVAMLGVGARGRGLVLPLLPSSGRQKAPATFHPLAAARTASAPVWVRLRLEPRPDARIAVFEGSERARDVRIDARVRRAALAVAPGEVWAQVRRSSDGPVAERLVRIAPPRWKDPRWWLAWGAQLAGLLLLAAVVWLVVVEPLSEAWFGPDGLLPK